MSQKQDIKIKKVAVSSVTKDLSSLPTRFEKPFYKVYDARLVLPENFTVLRRSKYDIDDPKVLDDSKLLEVKNLVYLPTEEKLEDLISPNEFIPFDDENLEILAEDIPFADGIPFVDEGKDMPMEIFEEDE